VRPSRLIEPASAIRSFDQRTLIGLVGYAVALLSATLQKEFMHATSPTLVQARKGRVRGLALREHQFGHTLFIKI
jgi:hypothetical protein